MAQKIWIARWMISAMTRLQELETWSELQKGAVLEPEMPLATIADVKRLQEMAQPSKKSTMTAEL